MSDESVSDRLPAEVWPPGEFIREELEARNWTTQDLAERMGGNLLIDRIALDMLILIPSRNMLVGEDMARRLGAAFGTSAEYWLNLCASYRRGDASTPPERAP